MDTAEAFDWYLLERIEPWGEKRADYRAARICEAIIVAQGGKMKFADIIKMFDFEPTPDQTDEEILALFKTIANRK